MLLAAGLGTRLRPYTQLRPKPLFPVRCQPLLLQLLDTLETAGFTKITVNCHHLADQVVAAVQGRARLQVEAQILGTGGALRQALDAFEDEPLLVMNGDIHHRIDLAEAVAHHRHTGNAVTMVLHDLPRFNTVAVRDDRVTGFEPGQHGRKLAYTGVQIIEPAVLEQIPRQSYHHIIDLYREIAPTGAIGMVETSAAWCDIGTVADYLGLHATLLAARQRWQIAPDAAVATDVLFEEWGVIGSGARIGRACRLRRCVVWDGAEIPPGADLEDALVCGDPLLDCQLPGWPGTCP